MIITGDVREMLKTLPDQSVHCCVTSPPYWGLRDYGVDGQLGLEPNPEEYVSHMVDVFREVRRVLRDDGTLWLNLGDSYIGAASDYKDPNTHGSIAQKTRQQVPTRGRAERNRQSYEQGLKIKDLAGIPWRVAFALQTDGWYLRSDIIWHKPNAMPESVADRPTKSHEYIFLMSKSPRYHYDADAIREPDAWERWGDQTTNKRNPGTVKWMPDKTKNELQQHTTKNKRTVWTISTNPFAGAHFATYPEELVQSCILAGCPIGGTVLDPFFGAGTTGLVAVKLDRKYIGIELNPDYVEIAKKRIEPEESQVRLELFTGITS